MIDKIEAAIEALLEQIGPEHAYTAGERQALVALIATRAGARASLIENPQ